ncbi:DUF2125 domain-containing protein [Maritalea mediterranea]|uniref:DUF2125 domain-containing protein n=1 Tax=Maritalea mediterranea TaxID=2909667 RepID=A0ABS9E9D4_9HYPH|nr:DUF2125 domain-containing protein [Maritalea mediterranea]MCF4099403.1 DUF2125 domain-containing protein [Maritalea mediterranea]
MAKFKIMLAIIFVVCGGLSAAWFFVARQIDQQIMQAINDPSVNLSCAKRSVSGYPFRFDVRCMNATVLAGDATISIPKIEGTALFYRPTHLLAFLEGPISYENAFTGAKKQLRFETANASARADFSLNLKRVSVQMVAPVWSDQLIGTVDVAQADLAELHLLARAEKDTGFFAYAKLDNVQSQQLGVESLNTQLEAEITTLDQNVGNWVFPQTLQQFAADEGQLIIENYETSGRVVPLGQSEAQDISVNAEGEFTLTEQGFLQGILRTSSKNIVSQIDLSALGPMAAAIVGTPDEEGKHHIPIMANAGVISVGMAPIYMVPALF